MYILFYNKLHCITDKARRNDTGTKGEGNLIEYTLVKVKEFIEVKYCVKANYFVQVNYCVKVKGDGLSKYDVKVGIVIVQFYG